MVKSKRGGTAAATAAAAKKAKEEGMKEAAAAPAPDSDLDELQESAILEFSSGDELDGLKPEEKEAYLKAMGMHEVLLFVNRFLYK